MMTACFGPWWTPPLAAARSPDGQADLLGRGAQAPPSWMAFTNNSTALSTR